MAAGDIRYLTALGQPSFADEVEQGAPIFANPLGAAEPTATVITQTYLQRRGFYRRPLPNQLCPLSIAAGLVAYFVDDTERQPVGLADLVTWQRSWATIPATYYDYSNISVIYPGYGEHSSASGYPIVQNGRSEFESTPRCRIDNEFYLVGPGGAYADSDSIPSLSETTVSYPADTNTNPSATFRLLRGGFYLCNTNVTLGATNPSRSTYTGWVSTDSGTADSYSIRAEQSTQSRYLGNIWRRQTIRVKAK